MAATAGAAALTEAHRIAQARLAANTTAQVLNVWPLLDPADLDGTLSRWISGVHPIVSANRDLSARLAAAYYQSFRTATVGLAGDGFTPTLAGPLSLDRLTAALVVTGPGAIKTSLMRGVLLETALDTAQAETARAATYHATNGGRETIVASTEADPRAIGWARAASGDPCAFCAMLASRGPVYHDEDTGGFEAHPGCNCTAEPTFNRSDPWPAGSRDLQRQWNDSQHGLPKSERGLNAFRRHLSAGGVTDPDSAPSPVTDE